ncbi:MAG: RHS repeat-associated core domain-containing protein [Fimbriimonadaceae bacterium]|nr:RHS repeat-associated core domain-containing protein [Fimbriimonadaceae bacterium]
MSNVAQQMVAKRDYDAFGNLISSTGTWGSAFGYAGGFGYQEDATGLKLLGHRYYDSTTGRFLTRDPIKDGRNWYSYGAGQANPVTGADPTGLIIWFVAAAVAIAACVYFTVKGGVDIGLSVRRTQLVAEIHCNVREVCKRHGNCPHEVQDQMRREVGHSMEPVGDLTGEAIKDGQGLFKGLFDLLDDAKKEHK